MVQKKDAATPATEALTKFCIVDRVDKFENVGVTRSTNGFVYLTCADCEMGPLGLKDPSGNRFFVAIERVTAS
uniref:Guanine nucleotide exchange factor MSS4 n=1 Tax=Panagrellus redivivus TaxID=6233 RepID=A0A7E4VV36_PANRE